MNLVLLLLPSIVAMAAGNPTYSVTLCPAVANNNTLQCTTEKCGNEANITRQICPSDAPAPVETYDCYTGSSGTFEGKQWTAIQVVYYDSSNTSWVMAFFNDKACAPLAAVAFSSDCAAGTCCAAAFTMGSTSYAGIITAGVTDTKWSQQCSSGPGAGTVVGYIVLVIVILGLLGGAVWYLRRKRTAYSGV